MADGSLRQKITEFQYRVVISLIASSLSSVFIGVLVFQTGNLSTELPRHVYHASLIIFIILFTLPWVIIIWVDRHEIVSNNYFAIINDRISKFRLQLTIRIAPNSFIKNYSVEDSFVEDDPVEDDSIENDSVEDDFLEILNEMGVKDGSRILENSKYAPKNCIDTVNNSLYFLGIFGTKWVTNKDAKEFNLEHVMLEVKKNNPEYEEEILHQFERMMKRIKESGNGEVKFLLISPENEEYGRYMPDEPGACEEINSTTVPKQYALFHEFSNKYGEHFKVHYYDDAPLLRMIRIDESEIYLSHYEPEDREDPDDQEDYYDAPHLEIHQAPKWSLFRPFKDYFDYLWEEGESRDFSLPDDYFSASTEEQG